MYGVSRSEGLGCRGFTVRVSRSGGAEKPGRKIDTASYMSGIWDEGAVLRFHGEGFRV